VFFLRARFNTEVDTYNLMVPTLIQGAAMSMFFIPLTSIILSGQRPEKFRRPRVYRISSGLCAAVWVHRS
jgi:hypothetical protein